MIEEKLINKLKTMEGFNKGIMAEVMVLPHNLYSLIFSHSFAKAFWGEDKVDCLYCKIKDIAPTELGHCPHCGSSRITKAKNWKYHLQQMVLEEEPLKYLEKFL